MNPNDAHAQPWYREPWPWILMSGPAIVVVAGLVTAWLAVRSDDGLVVDDYYKQGLAINQTLGRSAMAEHLGVSARLKLADGAVQVQLDSARAGALMLKLLHPTRSGMDQIVNLTMVRPGLYAGHLPALRAGRWHVVLEQANWRLAGDWTLPASADLVLDRHTPVAVGEEYGGGKR